MAAGFVHRIERFSAYVACSHPRDQHSPGQGACFLICSGCRKVAEIEDHRLQSALVAAAAGHEFAIRRTVLIGAAAFGGLRLAWVADTPAGPSMVVTALGLFLLANLLRRD